MSKSSIIPTRQLQIFVALGVLMYSLTLDSKVLRSTYSALLFFFVLYFAYLCYYNIGMGCPAVDRRIMRVPGSFPVLGSLLADWTNQMFVFPPILNQKPELKVMISTIPFLKPFIFILDPEIIEYVNVKNFDNYIRGELFYSRLSDLLGQGIFKLH